MAAPAPLMNVRRDRDFEKQKCTFFMQLPIGSVWDYEVGVQTGQDLMENRDRRTPAMKWLLQGDGEAR
jgi:hypothetical protein